MEIQTLTFPGRWMSDAELEHLRQELSVFVRECLGEVPAYGVHLRSRSPYRDRIITVIRSRVDNRVVAYSAMLLWHIQLRDRKRPQPVMHLGLVLVAPAYRGKKLMYALYHKPLVRFFVHRLLRPFWITSTTMEPVIVGSVADGFSLVHPHYAQLSGSRPTAVHRAIAGTFYREHGHEIGIWEGAVWDEDRFVIRGSSQGACRTLMLPYEETAKYRVKACNEFCRQTLDYAQGDEVLQVGRFDVQALLRSAWWIIARARHRFGHRAIPVAASTK